jgi:hypothetical protein
MSKPSTDLANVFIEFWVSTHEHGQFIFTSSLEQLWRVHFSMKSANSSVHYLSTFAYNRSNWYKTHLAVVFEQIGFTELNTLTIFGGLLLQGIRTEY